MLDHRKRMRAVAIIVMTLGVIGWAAPSRAALVGLWNLNEGYNPDGSPIQNVLDSSGNGFHGFLGFNDTVEAVDAPRSLGLGCLPWAG